MIVYVTNKKLRTFHIHPLKKAPSAAPMLAMDNIKPWI